MSIASVRLSPIAWRPADDPGSRARRQVLGARDLVGKHRADQILGAMRASCGGTFRPPRKRGSASDTPRPSASAS
jgi:hypothetical protein